MEEVLEIIGWLTMPLVMLLILIIENNEKNWKTMELTITAIIAEIALTLASVALLVYVSAAAAQKVVECIRQDKADSRRIDAGEY